MAVVSGSVLVSRDQDIVAGAAGMALHPLNRVFVLEDSQATVTFQDGCEQQLAENAILTITDSGTCAAAAEVERAATSQGQSDRENRRRAAAPWWAGENELWVTAGGLGAVGLFSIIALNNDDDDNPVLFETPQLPPILSPQ
jgi:hypothetical protein